jgi:hypothetical protein
MIHQEVDSTMTNNSITIDSSRTKERQQEQNDKQYKNAEGNYYNYNNYPARARAREDTASRFNTPTMEDVTEEKRQLPPLEIMNQIADAYRANVNPTLTQAAAGIIERALNAGMEPATVILAIEETGMASRPSPYYLSAVLRNWAEYGVVTSRARGIGVKVTDARPWWR